MKNRIKEKRSHNIEKEIEELLKRKDVRSNPPHHLSVDEFASYIGISKRTAHDLIHRREVRSIRIGQGRGRIILRLSDVERFIESKAIEAVI